MKLCLLVIALCLPLLPLALALEGKPTNKVVANTPSTEDGNGDEMDEEFPILEGPRQGPCRPFTNGTDARCPDHCIIRCNRSVCGNKNKKDDLATTKCGRKANLSCVRNREDVLYCETFETDAFMGFIRCCRDKGRSPVRTLCLDH